MVVKVNFLTQGKSPHQLWPPSQEFSGVSVVSWVRNSLSPGCKTENSVRGCCLFIRIGNTQLSGTFRKSRFLLKKSKAMKDCVSWLPARRQVLSGLHQVSIGAICHHLLPLILHSFYGWDMSDLLVKLSISFAVQLSTTHSPGRPFSVMHCSLLGQMRE